MQKKLFKVLLLAGTAFFSTETMAMHADYANLQLVPARVAASKLRAERDAARADAANARPHYVHLHSGAGNESDTAKALKTVGKGGADLQAAQDEFLAVLVPALGEKVVAVLDRIQDTPGNALLDNACPDIAGGVFTDANRNTFDAVLNGMFVGLDHTIAGMPGAIVPGIHGVTIKQLAQFEARATSAVADAIVTALNNGGTNQDPYLSPQVLSDAKAEYVATLIPHAQQAGFIQAVGGGGDFMTTVAAALNQGDMPGAQGAIDNAMTAGGVTAQAIQDASVEFALFPVDATRGAFVNAIQRIISE